MSISPGRIGSRIRPSSETAGERQGKTMTIQTKHFIEVSDIVTIRLSCKRCDSSLLLPLLENLEPQLLSTCPQCYKPWVQDSNGAAVMAGKIQQFVKALRNLDAALQQRA